MREILFKAKQLDNGKWVHGFFCGFVNNGKVALLGREETNGQTGWHVDPETVCQYTGFKDANGDMIFEGDIVQDDDLFEYVVQFKNCGFVLNMTKRGIIFSNMLSRDHIKMKVIGNIHDTKGDDNA